jgi:D-aspartate ligase
MGTNVDAIVLGLGINGLAVIRSLGERGLKVSGLYNDASDEIGRYSKYLSSTKCFDKNNVADVLFQACVDLLGDEKSKPVLICTTDLFSELVASNSELFESRFILTTPKQDLYWKFLKKQPTASISIENNLKIPKTIFVKESESLLEKCENLEYPVIIKPDVTFEETFPAKVIVASVKTELLAFIEEYPHLESKVVVQEIIPSGDGKLYMVSTFSDQDGEVKAIYTGKKVRSYLPDFGVTSYGISCSCEELKVTATKFLNDIKYTGFADLEFAYDEDKDEFYFIELNIRTSYLNQLYKDSGVDLNYVGYLAAKGKDFSHLICNQVDGVRWCDLTRDLGSCYRKIKAGKVSFFDCIIDILKARSFAYFNLKDLRPFLASLLQIIQIQYNKFKRVS